MGTQGFLPGLVLGFANAVGRLDELGRVIAGCRNTRDEFGQLLLVPLDFLGQISGDTDIAVIEMDDAGVLICCQA